MTAARDRRRMANTRTLNARRLILAAGVLCAASAGEAGPLRITVLYDNTAHRPDCRADWGFSCLIEGTKLRAVLGGFHLLDQSDEAVAGIVARFQELGVDKIGATHCTGEKAIEAFRSAYGVRFIEMGAGRVLECPLGSSGSLARTRAWASARVWATATAPGRGRSSRHARPSEPEPRGHPP